MFIVNMSQLADVLDASKFALYASLKGIKEKTGDEQRDDYRIDIDEFLSQHKVNTFLFDYEKKRISFGDQLKAYNFPDFISANEVRCILDMNNYQISKLRRSGEIIAQRVTETRYIYDTNSVLSYAYHSGKDIRFPFRFKYSKQFYTPVEVTERLEKKYGLKVSRKTLYRYIYKYNSVPCIKVSGNLRIPINEFEKSFVPQARYG